MKADLWRVILAAVLLPPALLLLGAWLVPWVLSGEAGEEARRRETWW